MTTPEPAQRLRAVDWSGLAGLGTPLCAALSQVLRGAPAERVLDRLLRDHRSWSSAQRRAVVEALFGVSLWRRRLAALRGMRWSDPPSELAAALADRTPELLYALLCYLGGLEEQRALALSGWTPASLPLAPITETLAPAELHSLPDWLWAQLVDELGADEAGLFARAIAQPGPIFVRANRLRTTRLELRHTLEAEGIEAIPCRFSREGLQLLTPRPNILALPSHRAGLFEVQDEGSQLIGELLEAQPGEQLLDACAGAGGKSLQLAAAVGAGGQVLCADPDRARLERLRTRAAHAGAGELIAFDVDESLVDRVLVDAPCSELGTLRRGPDSRWRISRDSLATLPALQLEILRTAAQRVRPGGRLVYATCTIRRAENQEVVEVFEQAQRGFARLRPGDGWLPEGLIRDRLFVALPHLHDTDGFFAAVWQRIG